MKNEKDLFYWFNNKENKFVEAYGKKINIEGYMCFILENDNNTYSIVEAKTGSFLSSRIKSKKEAIETAKTMVNRYIDKMDILINESINKIGISPLYKEVTKIS
jgi:hypothetical protein